MLRIVVIAVAGAAVAAPAIAQDWPTRPVTMVVTFAAGTAGDVIGRILSGPLGEALGKTVIIDNVPGGGGITGRSISSLASRGGSSCGCVRSILGEEKSPWARPANW